MKPGPCINEALYNTYTEEEKIGLINSNFYVIIETNDVKRSPLKMPIDKYMCMLDKPFYNKYKLLFNDRDEFIEQMENVRDRINVMYGVKERIPGTAISVEENF